MHDEILRGEKRGAGGREVVEQGAGAREVAAPVAASARVCLVERSGSGERKVTGGDGSSRCCIERTKPERNETSFHFFG